MTDTVRTHGTNRGVALVSVLLLLDQLAAADSLSVDAAQLPEVAHYELLAPDLVLL